MFVAPNANRPGLKALRAQAAKRHEATRTAEVQARNLAMITAVVTAASK